MDMSMQVPCVRACVDIFSPTRARIAGKRRRRIPVSLLLTQACGIEGRRNTHRCAAVCFSGL